MGLVPLLRPGEPSQAPYWEARGERQRGSPNREPSQQGPHHAGSRAAAAQEWLSGSQLCWGGRLGEGSLGPEIKGSGSPLGPGGPVAAGLQCSVAGRAQVGGGEGLGAGGGSRAELSSPRRKLLLGRERAAVTAPPLRTPARCPPLPPSPVFWVCPLVFSLELWWFSGSWWHPCFCSPSVGPEVS